MADTYASKRPKAPDTAPLATALRDWIGPVWSSTVGAKFFVALTGLVAVAYVVGHLVGNLQLWLGPDAINSYAAFLKSKGPLLWAARLFLLAAFAVHIYLALRLYRRNRTARPVPYACERTVQASWASRHMVSTGLVLLAFVVFHVAHFTWGAVVGATVAEPTRVADPSDYDGRLIVPPGTRVNYLDLRDDHNRPDVYAMVYYGFRNPLLAGLYVLAMVALFFHLSHGVSSLFQSLGLSNARLQPILSRLGLLVAVLVAAGNIALPLSVLFGDVPPPPPAAVRLPFPEVGPFE
jgi:succinate dehydrogenase / fumarate reductase cytochrome b subunit